MDYIAHLRTLKQTADEKGVPELMTLGERAILALADHLDKLEADPTGALAALWRYKINPDMPPISPLSSKLSTDDMSSSAERQPNTFRVTGSGKYRQSDGQIATVTRAANPYLYPYVWVGYCADGLSSSWTDAHCV